MRKTLKKYSLLIVILLAWLTLNYNPQLLFKTSYQHCGWNLSLLASAIIILLMKRRNPTNWKQILGIDFDRNDIWRFLFSTGLILVLAYFLVRYVVSLSNYSYKPQIFFYKDYFSPDFPFTAVLSNYLYFIPQTFNEEMIIGAMLLFSLERKFHKINNTVIALTVALIFSFMHQALYKFSPAQSGILLTPITISTLFFVGVLRNVLILKTRKITYSWAIHLSFNLVFFPGFYINESTNTFTSEPEMFNLVFGNWPMFVITGVLAIFSILWINRNRKA